MLTSRGYWILLVATILAVCSLIVGQFDISLLALAVLLWLGVEWATFAVRVAAIDRKIVVERRINGQTFEHGMLWAGQSAKVEVLLTTGSWLPLPDLQIADFVPFASETIDRRSRVISRQSEVRGVLSKRRSLSIAYDVLPAAPGRLRFEGVEVEVNDRMGMFRIRTFLRSPREIRVLPPLSVAEPTGAMDKRVNLLPARGIHRHRQPGTSSELLDLRDYQPGDPPRTIAWKISARRDRLITKQFESEVPVRCTILIDGSDSMRLGTRSTPLLQAARIAAGLSRGLLASNDPVGLCVFTDQDSSIVPPGLGRRQLIRILARIAETIATPSEPTACPPHTLIGPAWSFAEKVYPDLLESSINRGAPLRDHLIDWLRRPALWGIFVAFAIGVGIFWTGARNLGLALLLLGFIGVGFAFLLAYFSFFSKPGSKTVSKLVLRTKRKRLASLLASVNDKGPGSLARMIRDDDYFSQELQSFLIQHQVPFRRPLFDSRGRYLFASPQKLSIISRLLLRSVAHGRDNELFVLLVDLLELRTEWEGLIRTIKVAVARHHQVVLLCPWPEGLPAPEALEAETIAPAFPTPQPLELDLLQLDRLRHRQAYLDLKRELGRIGVTFLATTSDEAISDTLRRVERIRAGRTSPLGTVPAELRSST